jgi:ribosomal protein S26
MSEYEIDRELKLMFCYGCAVVALILLWVWGWA